MKKDNIVVCLIGDYPPKDGGISQYIDNLSKQLIQKKIEVYILTRGVSFRKKIVKMGKLTIVYLPFFPLYPFHVRIFEFFLHKELNQLRNRIDIIHYNSPLYPYIEISIPIITTSHVLSKKVIESYQRKSLYYIISKLFKNYLSSFDEQLLKKSNKIISLTNQGKKDIINVYGIKESKICIVPNGVNINTNKYFTYSSKPIDEFIILFTGRHSVEKGLYELLNAFCILAKKYDKAKLILTGKGPLTLYIKRFVEEKGLEKNVIFAGFVDRLELNKLYEISSVFILPSYYEGLSTSLLEAMSFGLPCITTSIPNNAELIKNNINGILIPSKNAKSIVEAIEKIIEDKKFAEELGNHAKNTVMSGYSWDLISNEIIRIYFDMIDKSE